MFVQVLDSSDRDEHCVEFFINQRPGGRQRPQRTRSIGKYETSIASPDDSEDDVVLVVSQQIVGQAVGIRENGRRKAFAWIGVTDPSIFIRFLKGIVAEKFEASHDALCSAGVSEFLVDGIQQRFGEKLRATQQQYRPSSREIRRALIGFGFGNLSTADGVGLFEQWQNARFYGLVFRTYLLGKIPFIKK